MIKMFNAATVATSLLCTIGPGCSDRGAPELRLAAHALSVANERLYDVPGRQVRDESADTVWPQETIVALNSSLLEESSVCRGDLAVVYASAGSVLGTEHEVTLGSRARVEGSITARGVSVAEDAAVHGQIRAHVLHDRRKRPARPSAGLYFPLAVELPAFPRFIPGGEQIDVAAGETRSLRAGSYGTLALAGPRGDRPAVVTLEGGIYDFEHVELGPRGRIECMAACEIRVENSLRAAQHSYLGPAPQTGISSPDVHVFVAGFNGQTGKLTEEPPACVFADGSVLEARVYVPNGTLRLGAGVRATGRLVARDVVLGREAFVVVDTRPTSEEVSLAQRGPLLFREASEIQTVKGQVRTLSLKPGVVVIAGDFFKRYGATLGLGSQDTMVELGASTDPRGHIHRRFEQRHRGMRVFGAGYILEEVEGRIIAATGSIVDSLDIQPTPTLTEEQALARALEALPAKTYAWERPGARGRVATRPHGRLGIGSVDFAMTPGSSRLVYRFSVSSVQPAASETIDIDAHTGQVVARFSNIAYEAVPSQGDTLYYGTRTFQAEKFGQPPGQYRLEVPAGSGLPAIYTVLRVSDDGGDDDFADFVRDQNDFSYWPAPDRETAESKLPHLIYGVSVHWGIQRALAYLKPFDVQNLQPPQKAWGSVGGVLAEYKQLMPGGSDYVPLYNSDDEAIYFPRTGKWTELVTLGVVGHEFAHGLLRHVVPEYVSFGESGAVDEGLADVFGILLSAKEGGTAWCAADIPVRSISYKDAGGDGSCGGGTSLCPGEQCDPVAKVCSQNFPAQCLFRNLAEPKTTGNPDTYLGPNYVPVSGECAEGGECHKNSTIAGHWLYILVNGKSGTNGIGKSYSVKGIGFEKAGTVVLGTIYLKLWGATTFEDLRAATIKVAIEQFGEDSPEMVSVANAWYAVGVGKAYDPRSYTPTALGGIEPWPGLLTWSTLANEFEWEAQVSTSPKFDTEVKTVSADVSIVSPAVPGVPKQLKVGAHVNLKPATKYFWRVRSKVTAPPASSGGSSMAIAGPHIPATPGSKRKAAPPSGSGASTMTLQPAIPVPPDALWGAWGNTQQFVTAAKIPTLHAPAPKVTMAAADAQVVVTGGGNLEPPISIAPPVPPMAEGSQYPWKTEFRWGGLSGAKEYRITASTSSVHDCDQTHLSVPWSHTVVETVPATKAPIHQIALRSGRDYYWWLKVFGPEGIAGGCSFAGSPVKFTTSTPTTTLVSPPDGSKVSPFDIPLSWKATAGVGGYQVEIAPDQSSAFSVATEPATPGATIQVNQLGSFKWRVRPKGPLSADYGAYTAPWTFVADKSLTKPEPLYPLETDYPQYGGSFYFKWRIVAGAENYRLTIYHRKADGSTGSIASEIIGGTPLAGWETEAFYLQPPGTLTEVDGYCWKIAPIGSQGLQGADSDVRCFDLGAAQPTITYPPDGATDIAYSPSTHFSWSSQYAPKGFRFSMGVCPFYAGIFNNYTLSSQTHVASGLAPNTNYCWKIVGIDPDDSDASSWALSSFTTGAAPPPAACKALSPGAIEITWPAYYVIVKNLVSVHWTVNDNDPPIQQYRVRVFLRYAGGGYTEAAMPTTYEATSSGTMVVTLPYFLPANAPGTSYDLLIEGRTGSSCSKWYELAELGTFFVGG